MKSSDVEIKKFNNWAAERIEVLESLFESQIVPLNYGLTRKKTVHKDFLENCFKCAYTLINEEIKDTKWRAEEADLPEEVLEKAIKAFKELKARIRKEKAEYKKAFKELQESINQSIEDEAYIQENETLVADTVRIWCSTHQIKDYMKEHFTEERLQEQIHFMTKNALTSKLHPNEDELKEIVEQQLKRFTAA